MSRAVAATLHFDGACRGNPGTAGTGFVLRDGNGRVIERFSRLLGYNLTNNVAEYKALIAGLRHALRNGITDIVAYGDSDLLCNQVNGQYQVRDERLRRYYNTVLQLLRRFQTGRVLYVPREQNQEADRLANRGIEEDPVEDCTDEILRRCRTPQGAMNYVLEKRCEGFSQLCFILDTIQQNFPDSYAAIQQWCGGIENLTGINDDNPGMANFLVQY